MAIPPPPPGRVTIPDVLPVLPLREAVVLPLTAMPLDGAKRVEPNSR